MKLKFIQSLIAVFAIGVSGFAFAEGTGYGSADRDPQSQDSMYGEREGKVGAHGMKKSSVQEVQRALNEKGYAINVDGIMGPQTKQALRNFQRDQGLSETGQLDQRTLSALGIEGDRAPASVPGQQQQGIEQAPDSDGRGTDNSMGGTDE